MIQAYCLYVGIRFKHEWGEEMHVESLSQGLTLDLAQAGLKLGPPDPKAKCLPLDHDATKVVVEHWVVPSHLDQSGPEAGSDSIFLSQKMGFKGNQVPAMA